MENRTLLNQLEPIVVFCAITLLAVFLRLIPHPPNVAPIAALALFGGVYAQNRLVCFIPFAALAISDYFLGFHDTMIFVYGSFAVTFFLGRGMRQKAHGIQLFYMSLITSILFFFITNFGVWLVSDMYAKTASGLIRAYGMGIPFFRNTIIGDLGYVFGLFYGYRYLLKLVKTLHIVRRYSINN